jgi:predicted RNA-binding Zn-ribbon protein involved in translation (DUF1610 family)
MVNEYIRKQDAVDLINKISNLDLKAKGGICISLANLQKADVVQVIHGKWKKIGVWGRVYRCDQCGNFLDFDAVNAGRGDANFCPNCGAKMDGKRKE